MVKTYFTTVRRMFKKHLIRLFSLIGIVLISVGFISGIGSPTDMIKDSIENYYTKQSVSDFIVKSKTGGFTDEQIAAVKSRYGENNVETGMSFDIRTGEKRSLRLYFLNLENAGINKKAALQLLADQKKLVLLVTHDPHTALMAKERILIKNGAVFARKTRTKEEETLFLALDRQYEDTMRLQSRLRKGENLI